jgi:hypothetical protein
MSLLIPNCHREHEAVHCDVGVGSCFDRLHFERRVLRHSSGRRTLLAALWQPSRVVDVSLVYALAAACSHFAGGSRGMQHRRSLQSLGVITARSE